MCLNLRLIVVALSSRRTRCDAEGFFDRGRIVNLSALEHGGDVAGVANVLRRVAIDEDHVGEYSGGDAAAVCNSSGRPRKCLGQEHADRHRRHEVAFVPDQRDYGVKRRSEVSFTDFDQELAAGAQILADFCGACAGRGVSLEKFDGNADFCS